MRKFMIIFLLVFCGSSLAEDYTFGDWATDAGLTGNETYIDGSSNGITDLPGLANNYYYLNMLDLSYNAISGLENGDFYGLTNLYILYMADNQINEYRKWRLWRTDASNELKAKQKSDKQYREWRL